MARQRGNEIVVTGAGIVSSIGYNVDEYASSLSEGRTGIRRPARLSCTGVGAVAELDLDRFEAAWERAVSEGALGARARRCAGRAAMTTRASVIACMEAWRDAGLALQLVEPRRLALIVAGNNLTGAQQFEAAEKYRIAPEYVPAQLVVQGADTYHLSLLSEVFEISGEGFTVGGASASANVALIKALQALRGGLSDACLVVAPAVALSPVEIRAYLNVGAMSRGQHAGGPEESCRPFDAERDGFVFGEACACVVLEQRGSAARRGRRARAGVLGGATYLAGSRLPSPSQEGERIAMERALEDAGLTVDAVEYINAHASASTAGDDAEVRAIRALLGHRVDRVWVNATKALTGHALSGAGLVELVACVVQMERGFLHPNLNLRHPIEPGCRFCPGSRVSARPLVAMTNAFGFGGINTSVVLQAE